MTQLFNDAVPAQGENMEQARRFTNALEADGGTEMLPASKAALVDNRAREQGPETLRQVIFLTGGNLSNEAEMMPEISRNRGRSRVLWSASALRPIPI
jgi:Ca-activated chloride channel family protein